MLCCVLYNQLPVYNLVVTLGEDLQWNTHIKTICASASRTLGFLWRNLKRCPTELRELAYRALVRVKLEYACSVWDPYLTKDKDLLENIQRRVARFVKQDCRWSSSVTNMLTSLGWDLLETRRREARLGLIDRIVGGRVAVNLSDYLTEASTRTRAINSLKFRCIGGKSLPYKNSFFPRTISDCNSTATQTLMNLTTSVSMMAD